MQARADGIGATLSIEAAPGRGVRISLDVPVE
jgi:signal transduction histidine kinase